MDLFPRRKLDDRTVSQEIDEYKSTSVEQNDVSSRLGASTQVSSSSPLSLVTIKIETNTKSNICSAKKVRFAGNVGGEKKPVKGAIEVIIISSDSEESDE